jgi:hypothetical protein
MPYATSTDWDSGARSGTLRHGFSKRPLEIAGIIVGLFWFWPAALAYLVWKVMGYPAPRDWRERARAFSRSPFSWGSFSSAATRGATWSAGPFAGTGNAAFDDYRRAEIDRLEAERRKLDDEAREFRSFVEELKRAKDREEFDAFMAKRRSETTTTTA